MAVDDLDLDRGGVPPPQVPSVPQRSWNRWLIAAAVVLAIAGGALARWWTMPARTAAETPAPVPPVAGTEVPLDPAANLPPLDQMDPFLRTLLAALSARPELAAWLATDDLIYQAAWTIDRVSRGSSPAGELRVLAPEDEISTARTGRVRRLTDASFQRYDGVAGTITSMDPEAVARAYRTIRPRLNEAYKSLGQTEASVDVAVQQALDLLIATPIPDGPIEVIEGKGATWMFADPALEALPAAQKHLLRMGPQNAAAIVQALVQVRQRLQP
jgi:hypothetical protein